MNKIYIILIIAAITISLALIMIKLNEVVENQETIIMTQEINMQDYCMEVQPDPRESEDY